jgi:hypothetical protein
VRCVRQKLAVIETPRASRHALRRPLGGGEAQLGAQAAQCQRMRVDRAALREATDEDPLRRHAGSDLRVDEPMHVRDGWRKAVVAHVVRFLWADDVGSGRAVEEDRGGGGAEGRRRGVRPGGASLTSSETGMLWRPNHARFLPPPAACSARIGASGSTTFTCDTPSSASSLRSHSNPAPLSPTPWSQMSAPVWCERVVGLGWNRSHFHRLPPKMWSRTALARETAATADRAPIHESCRPRGPPTHSGCNPSAQLSHVFVISSGNRPKRPQSRMRPTIALVPVSGSRCDVAPAARSRSIRPTTIQANFSRIRQLGAPSGCTASPLRASYAEISVP